MRLSGSNQVKLLLLLLGLGLFVFLVVLAGPGEIAAELGRFGWGFPLLLLPYLAVYAFDTWGWREAFERPPGVSYPKLFFIRAGGESINYSMPSAYIGGEPVKVLILQRLGVSGVLATSSVIVAKTTLTLGQILFVLVGLVAFAYSLGGGGEVPGLFLGTVVCVGIGLLIVVLLVTWQRRGFSRPVFAFARRTGLGLGFLERHREPLARLDQALKDFHRSQKWRFWRSTGLFLAGWLVGSLEVYLFSELLGLGFTLVEAVAIESLASVAKAAAFFIPGSLGAQEGGNVLLFLAFGSTELLGVTFSLVRRMRELVWIGLGFAVLAWFGLAGRALTDPELGS